MTTSEAIDRLRACGVEGLPEHRQTAADSFYIDDHGRYLPSERSAALIAFALGVQWLRDQGWRTIVDRHEIVIASTFHTLSFPGDGSLSNVVAAVEAAGRGRA